MTTRTWTLPPLRRGRPAPDDLVARRNGVAAMAADAPEGVTVRDATFGGVPALVCEPVVGAAIDVLYLHGGGYRLGAPNTWLGLAGSIALGADARVVLADYRLAPENPFPAAVHDATAAYDAMLEAGPRVVVGGDSAGGGLAVALAVACAQSGVPSPPGVFLLSPWVDLTVTSATYRSRVTTDQMFPEESAREAAELYLQGHDARDPLASPLFADLTGFPPTLVFAGGDECLLGDALNLTAALAESRSSVECHVVQGMQHVWPLMSPHLPESEEALAAIARFVKRVAA